MREMAIGVLSVFLVLLCARFQVEAAPGFSGAHANLAKRHAPDEVLVQYKADSSDAQKSAARGRAGAESLQSISNHGNAELEIVRLRGSSVGEAIARIGADPSVEFVEPNYSLEAIQAVTDAYFASGQCQLWGMYGKTTTPCANEFGSNAAAAWAAGSTGSNSVHVGVVDEGIQVDLRFCVVVGGLLPSLHHTQQAPPRLCSFPWRSVHPVCACSPSPPQVNHPDLAANVWVNAGEKPGNGVDDDGNGLKDDVNGYDFIGKDGTVYDGGLTGKVGTQHPPCWPAAGLPSCAAEPAAAGGCWRLWQDSWRSRRALRPVAV